MHPDLDHQLADLINQASARRGRDRRRSIGGRRLRRSGGTPPSAPGTDRSRPATPDRPAQHEADRSTRRDRPARGPRRDRRRRP